MLVRGRRPRPGINHTEMVATKQSFAAYGRLTRRSARFTMHSLPFLILNGRVEQRLAIRELILSLRRRLETSPWDRCSKPWD
jgi:hypothetical protein